MEQRPWEANNHSASQEITHLYEIQSFITIFTKAHHWSLTSAKWTQSTTFYPISLRSILTLPSDLHLGLPSGLFPQMFSNQYSVHIFHLSHMCHMPCHLILLDEVMKLLIMQSPSASCHFLPHRSKYSPQHPVLKHPQSMFLPYYEVPSFTPHTNNRQNYCFCTYFNLLSFSR
jgi:hypothetical protein